MVSSVYRFTELAGMSMESLEKVPNNKNEITELMREHQAIKMQMKFLTESFKSVATVSSGVIKQSIELNDLLRFYLWPLYDFREAINLHFILDERIFTSLGHSLKDIAEEHQAIKKDADNIIQLAESAVYDKLSQEELVRSAFNIRETFKRLCELLEAHATKEGRLLK